MPRLSDLKRAGHCDLCNAIQRTGGANLIRRKAGLVPYREWNYIFGMYHLLLELRSYLDLYYDGDYTAFPIVYNMKEDGYERLHLLIQFYGGRKFLAGRLGMEDSQAKATRARLSDNRLEAAGINWGPFDLEFAIELLEFVRSDNMRKQPPLRNPVIEMPSKAKFLSSGEKGVYLDQRTEVYGGYENVARRLGLAYFLRKQL
jgi:hypothetical protein